MLPRASASAPRTSAPRLQATAVAALLTCAMALATPSLRAAEPTASELFARGLAFETFRDATVAQREIWTRVSGHASPPKGLVQRLARVRGDLQLLVIAEDWCPDSVNVVPHVAALARASNVPLRVAHRTDGGSVMARHRTPDGRTATPTIVLLRGGMDVGAWVERPAPLQALFLSMGRNPANAELFGDRQAWYDNDDGVTTLTELVELAERTASAR